MINFFVLSCIGYLLLAVVSILDKFILTKSLSTGTYTFYSTIFFFGAFGLLPFTSAVSPMYVWWGIISSLSFGLGAWPMYIALKKGEATHVAPFIGATTTLAVFGFSYLILGESLHGTQLIGIVFLVVASLLFAYETGKKQQGIHSGYAWAALAGILFGFAHVTAKYFYGEYDFLTGLVWTKGFAGIIALITLFSLTTRKELSTKSSGKKTNTLLVVITKVLATGGTVLIQYAIAIGSVIVVNALVGLQYALVLLFAYVLTQLRPKFFREYFTKKEIAIEIFAIVLVVIGILFLI